MSNELQLESLAHNEAVRLKVRSYIIENFLLGSMEDIDFGDQTPMVDVGILDSTAAIELITFLESAFSIVIDEQEMVPENLNTVDSICAFVSQKQPR